MIGKLRPLAVLAYVVEAGSFRAAGYALDLSPSVVSHHITNLEKKLGCAIFLRTSRKLQLTAKGVILHAAAREMVDAVEAGLRAISDPDSVPHEDLRVSVPQGTAQPLFRKIVEDFMQAFPRVNLHLTFCPESQNPFEEDVDFAVSSSLPDSKTWVHHLLFDRAFGFYAAPDLVRKINKLALNDVPNSVPLILAPGFSAQDWLAAFSDLVDPEVTALQFRLSCNDILAAHHLVKSGMGIAALSEIRAKNDVKSGSLIPVLQELVLASKPLYAVWPKNAGKRSLTLLFLDHILRELDVDLVSGSLLQSG